MSYVFLIHSVKLLRNLVLYHLFVFGAMVDWMIVVVEF